MIKKIAWNTFKNTGNVDTFLELKQIQHLELQMNSANEMMQNIHPVEEQNGINQNEWYNNL